MREMTAEEMTSFWSAATHQWLRSGEDNSLCGFTDLGVDGSADEMLGTGPGRHRPGCYPALPGLLGGKHLLEDVGLSTNCTRTCG